MLVVDNQEVRDDFLKTLRFWCDRGVDGFRVDVAHAMIKDLETGDIDVAVLWGPIAGYYAKKSSAKLNVAPLAETPGTRMAFRIAFGVRHSDQNWKRDLNQFIAQNKAELEKILLDYGVPLIDEEGKPIARTTP